LRVCCDVIEAASGLAAAVSETIVGNGRAYVSEFASKAPPAQIAASPPPVCSGEVEERVVQYCLHIIV
jgi:hypothetical protein